MEESPSFFNQRHMKIARAAIIFSLFCLFGSAAVLLFLRDGGADVAAPFAAFPAESGDAPALFLKEKGIDFFSAADIEIQLDHYNPERLTIGELKDRFLPDDDRLTPFLTRLPQLFDFEEDGRPMRLFILKEPLSAEMLREWNMEYPDASAVTVEQHRPVAESVFFTSAVILTWIFSSFVQRKSRKGLLFLAVLFAAALLSGNALVLSAAVFIGNVFLSLWRKWQPQREYFTFNGVDLFSGKDKKSIAGQISAAVFCAVLPPLFFPGERLAAVAAVAMSLFGLSLAFVSVVREVNRPHGFQFIPKPFFGKDYRLPWKCAAAEIVLGVLTAALPIGALIFVVSVPAENPAQKADPLFGSRTYEEIYEKTQNQQRGTLNAAGYLEEKVFQYSYRYEKLERLPPPGYEVTVPHFFYEGNSVRNEKILIEIFTEDGFDSIMKKVKSDPLSAYFLTDRDVAVRTVPRGSFAVWIAVAAGYFAFLIPFFRVSTRKIRLIKYKD